MKERTQLGLLKAVLSKIINKTPADCLGFCSLLSKMRTDEELNCNERLFLSTLFKDMADKTSFVTREELEGIDFPGSCVPEYWLFLPNDWKSRRKWLKEHIKAREK